jgi:hypothetical protein
VLEAITLAVQDMEPPTAPTEVRVTAQSIDNEIWLRWTESTDDIDVQSDIRYDVVAVMPTYLGVVVAYGPVPPPPVRRQATSRSPPNGPKRFSPTAPPQRRRFAGQRRRRPTGVPEEPQIPPGSRRPVGCGYGAAYISSMRSAQRSRTT